MWVSDIFITEKVVWAVPNIGTCGADKAGCLDGAALSVKVL